MIKSKKVIVKVNGLKKYYGKGMALTKAVDGISFEIYEGEFLGIMGPSGSGKSTTLHLLGLLDTLTEGEIYLHNKRIDNLSEGERAKLRLNKIGYVFQQYRLIPEMKVYENVMLPYVMKTGDFNKAKKLAVKMLERVGIKHLWNHYPFEISGGEQQRVAIARALINSPEIIYADEPTASLDTNAGEIVMNLFKELNEKYHQTIVVVSHEVEHKKYFDRIIYIRNGKIEKIENRKKHKKIIHSEEQ